MRASCTLLILVALLVTSTILVSASPIVQFSDGFYLQTGLIEMKKGCLYRIPWLGFYLYVDNVLFRDAHHSYDRILARLLTPDGRTVAILNISSMGGDFIFDGTNKQMGGSYRVLIVGDSMIRGGSHAGVPYFVIETTSSKNWIPMGERGIILVNITTSLSYDRNLFPRSAMLDYLADKYDFSPEGRLNYTRYPIKDKLVIFYNNSTTGLDYAYIWSKEIFPWFNGNISSYIYENGRIVVFPGWNQTVKNKMEREKKIEKRPPVRNISAFLNTSYTIVATSQPDVDSISLCIKGAGISTGPGEHNLFVGGPKVNPFVRKDLALAGISFGRDWMGINGTFYNSTWRRVDYGVILLRGGNLYVVGTHRYGTRAALFYLVEARPVARFVLVKWVDLNSNGAVDLDEVIAVETIS